MTSTAGGCDNWRQHSWRRRCGCTSASGSHSTRQNMATRCSPPGTVRSAVAEVLRLLKAQKSVHPDDPRGFGHWSMAEMHEEMTTVFSAFRWVSFVFGGLALFAGVIGIMNIMLITIKERTRELGVRRALGATPANIVVQIMVETLTLTVLAGLVGGILGVATLEALDAFLTASEDNGIFRHPHVTLDVLLTALGTMTVLGALAGVLPALRALRVEPVEALRT